MDVERQACRSCWYGRRLDGNSYPRCCRLPPLIPWPEFGGDLVGDARFPVVKPDWWCGEYRPFPSGADPQPCIPSDPA